MGAVGTEQQVALAVDGPQQVGEFEIGLHGRLWSISQHTRSCRRAPIAKVGWFSVLPVPAAKKSRDSRGSMELFSGAGEFFLQTSDVPGAMALAGDPWPLQARSGGKWKRGARPTQFQAFAVLRGLEVLRARQLAGPGEEASHWPAVLEI